MKKRWVRYIMLIVILMGSVAYQGSLFTYVQADQGTINPDEVITKLDKGRLNGNGIKLDVPKVKPKVDRKVAEEVARKSFGGLINKATDVSVEFHLVTNETFAAFSEVALEKNPELKTRGHMDKTPAYIISYKGVSHPVSVPSDFEGPTPVLNEINVVVDANTGEVLMAFSNR